MWMTLRVTLNTLQAEGPEGTASRTGPRESGISLGMGMTQMLGRDRNVEGHCSCHQQSSLMNY